jgi:UDP-N-acetyl-D-galactosamine dehydrogenase
MNNKYKICVFGLGYVGLPIAIEFGKYFSTCGYDISKKKINNFIAKIDKTGTIKKKDFFKAKNLFFSNNPNCITDANFIIVCLPTPIDKRNKPDLRILIDGTKTIAKYLHKNSIVVFESTVYPTTTENICIPILEKYSGFLHKKDFFIGYSPERINPGDKLHSFKNITKVVSADSLKTLKIVKKIYQTVVKNKIFLAKNIKVAEASKIIENTQRDLNIALMNELSIIFSKINIKMSDVLEASKTKWNFSYYTPGLVGGHCIGVDPYYLSYFSKKLGHDPIVINAGRKVNDYMPTYVIKSLFTAIKKKNKPFSKLKINILGLSFKKNCSDLRNSKVIEIINFLKNLKIKFRIYDPIVDPENVKHLNLTLSSFSKLYNKADAMIISVCHDDFYRLSLKKILNKIRENGDIFDLMSFLKGDLIKKEKRNLWQL